MDHRGTVPVHRSLVDVGRLLVACPDRPGVVAAVSRALFERGANIVESQQYSTDPFGGTFFLRVEFHRTGLGGLLPDLRGDLSTLAAGFTLTWALTEASRRKRVAILVSRADHALRELLWRVESDELYADVALVLSNHPDLRETTEGRGVPFHHVPVPTDAAGRAAAEERQLELLGDVDLVVLARYMQIVSPRFVAAFPNRIINIHHSFLPAFAGANPYRAAAERGVKLIGATAHYVTAELDAGPIIEQDTARVDHRAGADDLRRLGGHVERAVLARAVRWHLEDRVLVHRNTTIVFS